MKKLLAILNLLILAGCVHAQQTKIGGTPGTTVWGNGQAAILSMPATTTFPATQQGSTSTQTATLSNIGTVPATITGWQIATGPNPADFSVFSTTCAASPFVLSPGNACDITFHFTPTGPGTRSANFTISSNALINGGTNLVGTGLAAAQSDSTLTPNTLTFPDTNVSTASSPLAVTLTSTGTATLGSIAFSITGTNAADFAITTNPCGTTLAVGLNCQPQITFTPSATGSRSAQLNVTSDGLSSPNVTLLSGNGIAPAATLSPTSLAFGSVDTSTTSPAMTATLTNSGSANLTFTSIILGGTNPTQFTESNDCVSPILPGNLCTITAHCAPTSTGALSATVTVTDNAPGSPHVLSLSCTGTTPAPSLAISTTSLNNCTVGQSCSPGTVQTTGGTSPIQFTVDASSSPPVGSIDVLDYAVMKLPDRQNQHLHGATDKCFKVQNNFIWWMKNCTTGNPWDGWWYDQNYVYFAFTEDGDSVDQAACQAAGYTSCFVDPNAYKLAQVAKKFLPRYVVPGTEYTLLSPDTLTTGNVNPFIRTTNCGADNQPILYLGNIKTHILPGWPFTDVNFGGDIGVKPYMLVEYFYSGNSSGVYQNRERYWLVQGVGQVQWDVASRQSDGSYLVSQTSLDNTIVAGGAPTPNFACTVPTPPFALSATLPLTPQIASHPPYLTLDASTGAIGSESPTTAGTYNFTVQAEDSTGAMATKALSITVNPASSADNRYANVNETCAYPGNVTADDIATLPTTCNRTDLANTPSPGSVVTVAAGDATAFQAALNTVNCGDTIVLGAGSTYAGSFTLRGALSTPPLNCDSAHWITIRTSRLDLIPTEGSRALPCDANVQLPSRPAAPYGPGNCGSRLRVGMAKIKSSGTFDEAIRISPQSHYYRFIGIEVEVKDVARTSQSQNIINMQATTGTDHIVFDRSWIHGIPDRSVVRAGFMQDGVSSVSLIDSSVTDIHCLASVCTDTQVFQTGCGSSVKKGFKGVNNYVESAGTNSMSSGGCGATVMSTDLEWRRNYQYKPMIWNPACVGGLSTASISNGGLNYAVNDILTVASGTSATGTGTVTVTSIGGGGAITGISISAAGTGYNATGVRNTSGGTGTGATVNITALTAPPGTCRLPDGTTVYWDGLGPYSVKNDFEVKNIIRGLVEGNVMENNWMHKDQAAFAILLTPKNQSGNLCPGCIERDITIRYNKVISSGGFFQIANAPADDGGLATEGDRYSIHDNLADNQDFTGVINPFFSFNTYGWQITSPLNIACNNTFMLNSVHIFHNTSVNANGKKQVGMMLMDAPVGPCMFGMQFRDNIAFYGVQGMNQLSNTACAGPTSTNFAQKFTNCWTNPFTMTKNVIVGGTGTWPSGNFLPSAATSVGWVNYNNGFLGDYRLCTGAGTPVASCTGASAYHNAATDGKDIGADINLVNQYTTGVSAYN